ncbi:MAG TPA: acireductone synthase [Terracidiphilus sp.]|nr:acireductone synthase [Terracidiphilus sp.]
MSQLRTRLFLLDVEGTVAPLTLVTEQLFPYARAHAAQFLQLHATDPEVRADLALLAQENHAETQADQPAFSHPENLRDANAYLLWLMDRDRKSTALKSLQGRIWKAGFECGELKGTLFPDVPQAFALWSAHAQIAIYSSGSVEAQKLLFRHSSFGDMTPRIAGYFDTRTGAKAEGKSYVAIAAAMQVQPAELLFFSDVVRELDAAREAGCGTRLAVRPGNPPVDEDNGHLRIESLLAPAASE